MVSTTTGYDVIVVGLGGMGSAAAYHLAARGCRVLGLERHEPAHDKGSSHGGSRIIRLSYFEDFDVYRLTGGLFIGPPDCLIVSGSLRASRQWDLPHEVLDAAEITARFPNFTTRPKDIALYDTKAGFARPEVTVRAHLEIAEKAGATLQFGEPVLDWNKTAAGMRVVTGRGSYTAGQLVICPGVWAPQVLGQFGVPITVERQVMYWLDPIGAVSSGVSRK